MTELLNNKTTNNTDKTLPHSIEAEQALLGELLMNNDGLDEISDFLKPEHFALPFHQTLFTLILKKAHLNQLASPLSLKEYLDKEGNVGEVSAYEYAMQLTIGAVSLSNAINYARVIYDMYMRRQLIDLGRNISSTAFEANLDLTPDLQIEMAEKSLFNLAEKGVSKPGFISFRGALTQAIDTANKAYNKKSKLSGYATHLRSLDLKLGGLFPSDLIILAGRPGMGKTSLATNIAYNIARHYKAAAGENDENKDGGIVGFFSLEMSAEQLASRIISEQTEISTHKLRRGDLLEYEFNRITSISQELENLPLYIDDTGGASIAQIASRARRLKRQKGLDVIVIDYIQLIRGSKTNNANRVNEITEITVSLKALAKELNVPIIALSQLSRQVETREGKRPQLSDLRESGSIEQDADIVLFVFREAYYKLQEEPNPTDELHEVWQEEMDKIEKLAEVIVAKHRHGSTGSIPLAFESEFTRFYDLADENNMPARIP